MLPKDLEVLIKLIKRISKTNTDFPIGEQPHVITQKVMFNQGVDSAIKTLQSIIDGNLKPNEALRELEED